MCFNLGELQPNKPVIREIKFDREDIRTPSGAVEFHDVDGKFQFQTDPLGYLLRYRIRARARLACVRCGEPVWEDVAVDDWITLRTTQPRGSHLVLDASEMNVRFIQTPRFDLRGFAREAIELELPTYPRHPSEQCPAGATKLVSEKQDRSSPFDILSKYLDS